MKWDKVMRDVFFYLVGVLFLLGFFALSSFIIYHAVPAGNEQLIGGVLETLKNGAILILGYFYGSSSGSSKKTDIIAKNGKDENPIQ